MTTTGVPAPPSVFMRLRADTYRTYAWVAGTLGAVLLLIGVVRLWQMGDMPPEIGVAYSGSALALTALGIASLVVAVGLGVAAAGKYSAAALLAQHEPPLPPTGTSKDWYAA